MSITKAMSFKALAEKGENTITKEEYIWKIFQLIIVFLNFLHTRESKIAGKQGKDAFGSLLIIYVSTQFCYVESKIHIRFVVSRRLFKILQNKVI